MIHNLRVIGQGLKFTRQGIVSASFIRADFTRGDHKDRTTGVNHSSASVQRPSDNGHSENQRQNQLPAGRTSNSLIKKHTISLATTTTTARAN